MVFTTKLFSISKTSKVFAMQWFLIRERDVILSILFERTEGAFLKQGPAFHLLSTWCVFFNLQSDSLPLRKHYANKGVDMSANRSTPMINLMRV